MSQLTRLLRPGLLGIALALTACNQTPDDFQWLEGVEDKTALAWVDAANARTQAALETKSDYQQLFDRALATLNAKDRLPHISLKGQYVYNLWQDETHIRGVYRRSPVSEFAAGNPNWETVLDLDALSARENKKWVFKGLDCLAPAYTRCLMHLSEGGGDSREIREFSTRDLNFIDGGFFLPAAKSNVSWMDENHLFVGTDFGADSLTDSGYPRQVRIWQRGTALDDAMRIHEAAKNSVSASATRLDDGQNTLDLVTESTNFWERNYHQLQDGKLQRLALPSNAVISDLVKGKLLVELKDDWSFNGRDFTRGSVLLIKPSALVTPEKSAAHDIVVLIEASDRFVVEELVASARGIVAIGLVDVKSEARFYQLRDGQWSAKVIDLPAQGTLTIETSEFKTGAFFARYEDFLTPPSLYYVDTDLNANLATSQAATFDASNMEALQYFATSEDGTRVPYFVVKRKDLALDGKNPTHMFSYGGFRVSLKPSYSGSYEDLNGVYGKLWLERGGVFVLANIRGGGEYGPAWHASVLKQNRPKAYEDFEAIARDLFARKITSAAHLGIEGRSNGGLLVGATMVRHPELYGAVICGVPLLDMQRYHTLLAGASWMAEYGNPDIAEEWNWLKTYSPFQNLKANVNYPPILFYTSTRDDRVHPGHARKMAARMDAMGQAVYYYENREGGHGGASTKDQLARRVALSYALLWDSLR
ncbi:prolyl oligopeptidase family serine peptidase [Simiduia agarivorans]|uniref:Peptidase S9 prolyl oligopeptidase n=1 Tax=Simiduia agarivorans (strain DSM 21679 / JCM 13881 / BCRC 17597 / SA1) TaxID=1117647 RepID=K4L473_SIMAS|nr:prolyl oligopeptidase family serine peptidase [Simiduia agarivorans]AFV01013.1 peptidase S9 prolyl oligopeptidase [Simiduia agarivorans SA1 = DSM 21679]